MLSLDQVIDCFDSIGDSSIHQNVLIEKLKLQGYTEQEINTAINNAFLYNRLKVNTYGEIRKI